MLSDETGMAERSQATSRWAALGDNLRGQWWIHVCIAVALLVVFDELSRDVSLLLRGFASNLLVSYCIGAATALVYVLGWAPPPGAGPLRRALAFGLSIVFGVVVGTELALLVLALVLGDFDVDTARMGVWRVGVVITALVVVVSLGYERLRAHVHAVELREQQAQQALLRAQLDSLQARMHPHFLFNALNTVASLIEDEPACAVEAVERLSLLLRHSLEAAPRDRVPLHSELEVVRGYLAIEGLRFGARLRCEVEVEPGLEALLVPPFVLQPLVENAVKHGIAARREGGCVRVVIGSRGDAVALRVEDDGSGQSSATGTRSGNALLRQRLALLYGTRASFRAGPRREGGFRVEIELPREPAPTLARAEAAWT